MTTYEFLSDYPDNDQGDWTDSLQGVTHNNDGYWIFTQKTRIFKFHLSEDLETANRIGNPHTARMPDVLKDRGCDHFGDPDYIILNGQGYLFVPVEGEEDGACKDEPVLAVFRDHGGGGKLEFLDWKPLPSQNNVNGTGRAGWCAISPADQLLYSSHNKIESSAPIFRYEIDFDLLVVNDELKLTAVSDFVLKDEFGVPLKIKPYIQGGAFSPDGKLYIVSGRLRKATELFELDEWKSKHGGVRVFDPSGVLIEKSSTDGPGFKYEYKPGWLGKEEPEGITFWDTDQLAGERHSGIEGQLHGVLLNKKAGDDHIWFKHYSVTPIPDGTGLAASTIPSNFCVNHNAQQTGEHEVHDLRADCPHLPDPVNMRHLGVLETCDDAIIAARRRYEDVDGCAYCVPDCHTR